ncbi:hypothetical protein BST91_07980 [Nonlabens tegetincola]|uniref:glycosyltransferase family 2 protein n=1 Tax=Nonlabens tegetincola TaxID=323273 RepID=UPI000A209B19|nr:glycosyltransferase [Nonlabens tegetincola]ARN71583.1 hypothetical protein BST91_07980 [Nonlabens tegetincola]
MSKLITIAICTYNRCSYLKKCLQSLLPQVNDERVEVLVVDNNSTDITLKLVSFFKERYSFLKYVHEPIQGLSKARNTAFKSSKSLWIAYLDDDGIPHSDYVARLLYGVQNFDFDCYGGTYYAYYEIKKPKWLSNKFGSKPPLRKDVGLIQRSELSGGIFVIKKNVLNSLEGFNPNYGMNGLKMGYGEENELQNRLLSKGYKLGYDPFLKMDHVVATYKLKWTWHVKRTYQSHKYTTDISYIKYDLSHTIITIYRALRKKIPEVFKKLRTDSNYYRQNLFIDLSIPFARAFGLYNNINKQ